MGTPKISQLLDNSHTSWISIRARYVMRSHRESRIRTQTADPKIGDNDEMEELQPLNADTELQTIMLCTLQNPVHYHAYA